MINQFIKQELNTNETIMKYSPQKKKRPKAGRKFKVQRKLLIRLLREKFLKIKPRERQMDRKRERTKTIA